jgi:hypothetical protein
MLQSYHSENRTMLSLETKCPQEYTIENLYLELCPEQIPCEGGGTTMLRSDVKPASTSQSSLSCGLARLICCCCPSQLSPSACIASYHSQSHLMCSLGPVWIPKTPKLSPATADRKSPMKKLLHRCSFDQTVASGNSTGPLDDELHRHPVQD